MRITPIMGVGLGIRITWDGAVVDERAFHGRGEVRVGAGARASAVATGGHERYLRFRRVGDGFELRVDPGAAERLTLAGEETVDLAALNAPFSRRLERALAFGRIEMGSSVVEFEPVALEDEARDRALFAWALAAMMMALLAGGTWRVVRLLETGWLHSDDEHALSSDAAQMLRVRIGPEGTGSSRPQAGLGNQLAGRSDAAHMTQSFSPPPAIVAEPHVVAGDDSLASAPPRRRKRHRPRVARAPEEVVQLMDGAPVPTEVVRVAPAREKVIEDAEAALLDADVRAAADGFSRAAERGELTYEQQTMLGLAFYLAPSLDQAERAWEKARSMEPGSADTLVNLAHVAKRRGDTSREIELLQRALRLRPDHCHALNNLALAQAKTSEFRDAEATRLRVETACGPDYAYGAIHHAGMLALAGDRQRAMTALDRGLTSVHAMVPVKEYEVYSDLTLDPAFASLRTSPGFRALVEKYLPRAVQLAAREPSQIPPPPTESSYQQAGGRSKKAVVLRDETPLAAKER